MRKKDTVVFHCAQTRNGSMRYDIEDIDNWHGDSGFMRSYFWRRKFNPHLKHTGYQSVVYCDGEIVSGRSIRETGAHSGPEYNGRSSGICVMGTDKFTLPQWDAMRDIALFYRERYPGIKIIGHNEFSTKECPGFDVQRWLAGGMAPLDGYIYLQ